MTPLTNYLLFFSKTERTSSDDDGKQTTTKIMKNITTNLLINAAAFWGIICIIISSSFVEGVEVFNPSKYPFEDVMDVSDIPQFVTITFDGDVTPSVASLLRQLGDIRDSNGCGIKSTFFVSFQNAASASTGGGTGGGAAECHLIHGIIKGQHEIATHTFNRTTNSHPTLDDIQAAIDRLNENCNIPPSDLRGFRSPDLQYSQDTLNYLNDLGLLYDSTLIPVDYEKSNYGYNETWPFTFTNQSSLESFDCRGCNTTIQANPGLWEIPMTPIYNPDNTLNLPMDYTPYYDHDISSILQNNLDRHYMGNRAPLGLYFHGFWLSANGEEFRNWINETLNRYDDVYFVTNYELIEWMRNPIPKDVYQPTCEGQITDCLPPEASCVFGGFDSETCECDCFVPYCKDTEGSCSRICHANETNAGAFSEFDSHCCPDGYNGYRPYENCTKFYYCILGEVTAIPQPDPPPPIPTYMCGEGTRFDIGFGACVFERDVTCIIEVEDAYQCGALQETPSPSSSPSMSFLPTITPVPTVTASVSPSSEPSSEPTRSYQPTREHSTSPTGSTIPSSEPSLAPSWSIRPSAEPTATPSVSGEPSSQHPSFSNHPTVEESNSPSGSLIPSSMPSFEPSWSSNPSSEPTIPPTLSAEPSIEPTPAPIWDYELAEPYLEEEREPNLVVVFVTLSAVALVGGLLFLAFQFQDELRELEIMKKLKCRKEGEEEGEEGRTRRCNCRKTIYNFFFGFLKDRPGI